MRRRQFLKATGAAAIGASFFSGGKFSAIAQEIIDLNDMLEPIRASHNVPALTAALVRGDTLAALGAVGRRSTTSETEVTTDDLWHLGSCTKSMTATLFGVMVEKGVLSWTTTLGDVFGDQFNFLDDYANITPLELLAHRSGIAGQEHPDQYNPLQGRVLSQARNSRLPIQQQRLRVAEDVLNTSPATTPATSLDYTNLGYIVAGAMLETLTGETWEGLMQSQLFNPLGITSAGFGAPGTTASPPDQPQPHLRQGCVPAPGGDNPPVLGPAGTVHISMSDWAKYASLHINGINLLPTPILEWDTFNTLQSDQFNQGYALGWAVTRRDWAGGTVITHNGSNTLWLAEIWLAPHRNVGLMAVTNCATDQAFPAIDRTFVSMINRFIQ